MQIITESFYSLSLDLVTKTEKIMTWTDDIEQILPLSYLCVSKVVEKFLPSGAASIPAHVSSGPGRLAALTCTFFMN